MTETAMPIDASFDERIHRAVVVAEAPGDALERVFAVLEQDIATAGTLLYRFEGDGRFQPLSGTLNAAVTRPWFFADDPCQDQSHRLRGPDVLFATRLVDRRKHERSTAYREFYGPRDIAHVACVRLARGRRPDSPMLGLFIGRSGSSGDFSAVDERRLREVRSVLMTLCRCVGAWGAASSWSPMLGREATEPTGATEPVVAVEPRDVDPTAWASERYGLTPTEVRVIECLADGLSNRELAEQLDIRVSTAKTHVKRVLGKLGVSSRLKAALTMQRIRLGIRES